MTSEMLKDLVSILKRRNCILIVLTIIMTIGFIGMSIFAFSNFEIITETETKIEYEAETGDGDNAHIEQINDMSRTTDNSVWIICFTIIFCTAIIVVGVVFYGKIKNESYTTQAVDHKKKISSEKEKIKDEI